MRFRGVHDDVAAFECPPESSMIVESRNPAFGARIGEPSHARGGTPDGDDMNAVGCKVRYQIVPCLARCTEHGDSHRTGRPIIFKHRMHRYRCVK